MTSGQRKAHKYIWLALLIVMPILIVFSIKDLNPFIGETLIEPTSDFKTSRTSQTAENDLISIVTQQDRLEIRVKTTVKYTTTLVYTLNSKDQKQELLGQIGATGFYSFPIKSKIHGIELYDGLKAQTITKLKFSWD